MTAEHPNIDEALLATPVNYFCVNISYSLHGELLQSDNHHLFHRVQSGGGGCQFRARLSGWFSSHDRVLTLLISAVMAGCVSAADAWLL